MSNIKLTIGVILIIIGIAFLFVSLATILWGIILIALGMGFIVFRKDEAIIEERQDLNKRKTK